MTKRNPEFGGFSACFAVRAETDQKGKATPPARTETRWVLHFRDKPYISTHSAREDGDYAMAAADLMNVNFNPLRPRGRRLFKDNAYYYWYYFNPLRPRGRRRGDTIEFPVNPKISTHSAREDGDKWLEKIPHLRQYFNPLRPRGRRPKRPT